ncbi:MAG: serine/threonine-protein kinase [Gemmatimonadales bacterium]
MPNLSTRVRDLGPLPPEEVAQIGRAIALALSAAHRRGMLHRDVQPVNILLDADGRAQLGAFNATRIPGAAPGIGHAGHAGGGDFIAPEVLAGQRGDARADLYALGMSLYYALTGRLPHRSSAHLPPSVLTDGQRPSLVRSGIPGWLDDAIARATAVLPADRYASAARLADALTRGERTALAGNGGIGVE